MDRMTVASLLFAGASVLASAVHNGNVATSARHACALILPLAVIAFPEAIDAGYRRSFRGSAHGGEGPTPAILIRVAAVCLLIVFVAVHHCIAVGEKGQ
jgi:hypothetical protein